MKRVILCLAIVALGITNTVKAKTLPESLIPCDSRFFSELYMQQAKFKYIVPLATDDQHHAWFDPPKDGAETVWFAQPIRMQHLTLSGYFLKQIDLYEQGKYYYWGLIFDESPEVVMDTLSQVNWQKSGDVFFANPMIKRPGDSAWQENTTATEGIAPAKGSVEKLLMISTNNDKTNLLCTIQGRVTDEILLPLRPDLAGGKND